MIEVKRIGIWDVTSKCNLRCAHCYNQERYWDKADNYDDLTIEEIKVILDKLAALSFTRVHLLGGEPLMATNLDYLISYARRLNIEVTMVTNGTLLDENRFAGLCNLGVKSISFSIDGTTALENDEIRGEGSFDRVVNNIKNADTIRKRLNNNINLFLSFTLTQTNLENASNLLEFAYLNGIDSVNVSYLSNEGAARNNYTDLEVSLEEKFNFIDKLISKYRNDRKVSLHIDSRSWLCEYIYKKHGIELVTDNLGCKGGDKQFYILADGQLLPCSPSGTSMGECLNEALPKDSVYPNLKNDSIKDIIESKKLVCFYNYTRSEDTYKEIYPCNVCKYTCVACPLLYHSHKIVDECVYAQKQIKRLDADILLTKFKKKSDLRIAKFDNKIKILNFLNQNEYIFEDISMEIWDKIDGDKTIEEITKEIYEDYESEDLDTIKNDLLQYVYQLKSLNLIY